jgi:hypothetical protein
MGGGALTSSSHGKEGWFNVLIQGRIAYARISIADPQGKNPKTNRPFVIITHFDDIKGAETVQGVAITSELAGSPDAHYYKLPTGPGRRKHGCSDDSAALCTWIENLNPDDLDMGGFLEPRFVHAIVIKVRELRPGAFVSRAPGEPKPAS